MPCSMFALFILRLMLKAFGGMATTPVVEIEVMSSAQVVPLKDDGTEAAKA